MSQILLGTYLHEKLFIFGWKFQFNRASWIFISCIWQLRSKPSWKADLRKTKKQQTLACVVWWVFLTVLATVFSLGFYPMHMRNWAGTFILISHARENQAQAIERQHTARHNPVHTGLTSEAQTPPGPPSTLKDSVLVGALSMYVCICIYIFFLNARNLKIYKNYKMRKDWGPIFSWLVSFQTPGLLNGLQQVLVMCSLHIASHRRMSTCHVAGIMEELDFPLKSFIVKLK